MERVCESYTRTALPSLTLNVKTPDELPTAASAGAQAAKPRAWTALLRAVVFASLINSFF